MGRVIATIFVVIGLVSAAAAIYQNNEDNLAVNLYTQSSPARETAKTISTDFNETGTLIFYPNNVGPVPYLFYQDSKKYTAAKALVFQGSLMNNLSSWSGARISVIGYLNAEHVVVSRITYISGP